VSIRKIFSAGWPGVSSFDGKDGVATVQASLKN
jgi:hypothetical protein